MTSSPIRIVDTCAADFASFAGLAPGPLLVCVDELAELLARAGRATAQRTEFHVDVTDEALTALAVRAVYPRRPLWRRIITRIRGAR